MLKKNILVGIIGAVVVVAVVALVVQKSKMHELSTASMPPMALRGLADGSNAGLAPKDIAYSGPVTYEASQKMDNTAAQDSATMPQQRMIIRTGQMSVVVKNIEAAVKSIGDFTLAAGGVIADSTIYNYEEAPVGTVTIRVPAARFEEARNAIKKMGELRSESTNGNDITEEFIDVSARLKNLQATESQLLGIMKKANAITDILAVQNELTRVRADIEVLQGRQKFLSQSAALSTLTLNLSTDPRSLPVLEQNTQSWKPSAVFKDAVRSLLAVGQAVVNGLIWIVVYVPLVLVGGGIIWLVWRYIKKHEASDRS